MGDWIGKHSQATVEDCEISRHYIGVAINQESEVKINRSQIPE
jgi:hypothetical protein